MIKLVDKQFKINDYITCNSDGYTINTVKLLEEEFDFKLPSSNYGRAGLNIGLDASKVEKYIKNSKYYFTIPTLTCINKKGFSNSATKMDHYRQDHLYICEDLKIAFDPRSYNTSNAANYGFYIESRYSIDIEYKLKIDEFINDLIKTCKPKSPRTKPKIGIVIETREGFVCVDRDININKDFSIESHYNDDIMDIYLNLIGRLKKNNDKGLVLFHGIPGSGKTSFIRHICNQVRKRKKVIFVPPDVAAHITKPAFMSFLMDHSNSILIIEDAENLLESRDNVRSNAISSLLNVTDGLLSDVLNIQIICTFNCELKNIDDALLRKGRVISRYEFKKLSLDKTKKLLPKADKEMTLAEIFNHEDKDFSKKVQVEAIGFKKV